MFVNHFDIDFLRGKFFLFLLINSRIFIKTYFSQIKMSRFFACFRWKLDSIGKDEINPKSKKKILQFVTVQRVDTGEWAIPGVKYKI